MEHLILTETDFFRLIDNPGSTGLGTAYNEFTTTVVSLCKERESICRTVFALSYAETELQYHDAMQETDSSMASGCIEAEPLTEVKRQTKGRTKPQRCSGREARPSWWN